MRKYKKIVYKQVFYAFYHTFKQLMKYFSYFLIKCAFYLRMNACRE